MDRRRWGDVRESAPPLDRGINLFDTADSYGERAREEHLERAWGSRRQYAVVATKFGIARGVHGWPSTGGAHGSLRDFSSTTFA